MRSHHRFSWRSSAFWLAASTLSHVLVACGASDRHRSPAGDADAGAGGASSEGAGGTAASGGRSVTGAAGGASGDRNTGGGRTSAGGTSSDSGVDGDVAGGGTSSDSGTDGDAASGGTSSDGSAGGAAASGGASSSGGASASACPVDCTANSGSCFGDYCVVPLNAGGGRGSAIDASYLYVASPVASGIWRVPLSGGAGSVFVNAGTDIPSDVVVDASYIYWTDQESEGVPGRIRRADKATGTNIVTLESPAAGNPINLLVDATYVYWVNFRYNSAGSGGGLFRKKKDGTGTVDTLDAPGAASGSALAFGSKGVYWCDRWNSNIRYVDVSTASPTASTFVGSSEPYPNAIATDATYAYWLNVSGTQALVRGTLSDGTRLPLITDSTVDTGQSIAVDGNTLYWGSNQNGLYKSKTDGTGVVHMSGIYNARSVEVGTNAIYYVTTQGSYRVYPK